MNADRKPPRPRLDPARGWVVGGHEGARRRVVRWARLAARPAAAARLALTTSSRAGAWRSLSAGHEHVTEGSVR